jgi:hypothetical protein
MTTRSVVAAAVLCAFAVGSASAKDAPHVPGPALPNHRLTPGAHFAVGKAKICKTGYAARVRDRPREPEGQGVRSLPPEARLVRVRGRPSRLARARRLQRADEPLARALLRPLGRAHTKDRLEGKLHDLVCAGKLSLGAAQRQEAANWINAYKRYVGKG